MEGLRGCSVSEVSLSSAAGDNMPDSPYILLSQLMMLTTETADKTPNQFRNTEDC